MFEMLKAVWAWLTVSENSDAVAAIVAVLALVGAFIGWLLSKRKKQAAPETPAPPNVATIILPADQLNALMHSVLSGPPEASTDKLIELSKQLGTTESAVRGFLQLLGQQNDLSLDELPILLASIAREHLALQARLAAIQPENPQEKAEVESIRAALNSGDNARAHALLEQRRAQETIAIADAERLQQKTAAALSRRRRALSDTEQSLGHLALTALDALAAADHFEAAARALPADDIEQRAILLKDSATALYEFGRIRGGLPVLDRAANLAKQAVEKSPRATLPRLWAVANNTLGNALQSLGESTGDTAHLDDAIQAFRAALEERTRQCAPMDWAVTQSNLGNALQTLGENTGNTARLDEAVQAYRATLEVVTQQNAPMEWASSQNNLGVALRVLGEKSGNYGLLNEAVQAYHAALEERTRQQTPMDWAMTQDNLGTALQSLSERTGNATYLIHAIQAYRAALEERTRQRAPIKWAMTQTNLGTALHMLGKKSGQAVYLDEAVRAYCAALEECTQQGAPMAWAKIQNNLGAALEILGKITREAAHLDRAVQVYRTVLEVHTRHLAPMDWARAQSNLGMALEAIAERTGDTNRLNEAVQAHQAALEVFESSGHVPYPDGARRNLAYAQASLARLRAAPAIPPT